MSDTESAKHQHWFGCPETARHAEPLDGQADLDKWVAREDRYVGKHREDVTA